MDGFLVPHMMLSNLFPYCIDTYEENDHYHIKEYPHNTKQTSVECPRDNFR